MEKGRKKNVYFLILQFREVGGKSNGLIVIFMQISK